MDIDWIGLHLIRYCGFCILIAMSYSLTIAYLEQQFPYYSYPYFRSIRNIKIFTSIAIGFWIIFCSFMISSEIANRKHWYDTAIVISFFNLIAMRIAIHKHFNKIISDHKSNNMKRLKKQFERELISKTAQVIDKLSQSDKNNILNEMKKTYGYSTNITEADNDNIYSPEWYGLYQRMIQRRYLKDKDYEFNIWVIANEKRGKLKEQLIKQFDKELLDKTEQVIASLSQIGKHNLLTEFDYQLPLHQWGLYNRGGLYSPDISNLWYRFIQQKYMKPEEYEFDEWVKDRASVDN